MERKPKLSSELWSKAFKAYKEGKEPIDLVIEGLLGPDEAKYAYEKFLEMSKSFEPIVKPKLTSELWSLAFKAFREGKKPMDLVLEGVMGPEEAKYAYEKFRELKDLKMRKENSFEIPDLLVALFLVGSFLSFIESVLLKNINISDPLYDLLLVKFTKSIAVILNSVISVLVLMALVLISSYLTRNVKLASILPLLFCVYKFWLLFKVFISVII